MGRRDSESPVRDRRSPHRKSPSRSERSPARHRNTEQPLIHKRSPRRARSRSPREKAPGHTRSPQRRKSVSPVAIKQRPSSWARSPKRAKSKSPPPLSLSKEKPSNRTRSPKHARSRSPELRKLSSRARSPKRAQSRSPESGSPSPRTKRLKRAQAERDDEKGSVRNHEKNRVRKGDGATHRERDSHGNQPIERRDRSGRDEGDNESSRVRRERSSSPSGRDSSPSPRTKRLKRAQVERDDEKGSVRNHEKNRVRKGDGATHRERDSDTNRPIEIRDRSGRDEVDSRASRVRRERPPSPSDRHYRSRQRSRSPRPSDSRGHDEVKNSTVAEQRNGDNDAIAKMKATEESLEAKEKVQKPSFELSGKLAEETNRVRGITLLFTEPPEARKPEIRWRLYVFKGGEVLNEPLYVHRLSCYLFGRERRVADIPTDHPSCSKQHAVLQYRQVEKENPDGTMSKTVKPYLMDLGSTNGTFINDNRLEPQRYYELFEKDTIKFGNSSREYVLLHENSSG